MIEDLARSKACLCKNAEMPGVFSVKVMHKVEFSLLANSTWMHLGKVSRNLGIYLVPEHSGANGRILLLANSTWMHPCIQKKRRGLNAAPKPPKEDGGDEPNEMDKPRHLLN